MAEQSSTETSPKNQPGSLSIMETSEGYSVEEELHDDPLPETDYSEKDKDLISLTDELQDYPTLPLKSETEDYLSLPLHYEPRSNSIPEIFTIFSKLRFSRERKDSLISESGPVEVECEQISFEVPENWNDNRSRVIDDFERPNEFARRQLASESTVVNPSESSPVALEFATNINVKKKPRSVKRRKRFRSTPSLYKIEGTEHLTVADVIQVRTLNASDRNACTSNITDELEDAKGKLREFKKDLDEKFELKDQRNKKRKLSPRKSGTSSEISLEEKMKNIAELLKAVSESFNELVEIHISSMTSSQNVRSSSEREIFDENSKPKSSCYQNRLIVAGGALCAVGGAHTIITQENSKGRAIGIAVFLLGYTLFLKNL
ncbi:uncharacterized protein LOC118190883 [Stegodyphus dumicola]|uniref:uncharacterized protein LOC118190883 n=1 Tax=Stegodyphus dumicola TaxID=202533 RepID=UPI0015AEAE23|nr:uncharacterized protein LOC118190883 [Stegodyphus dumicola]